MPLTGMPTVIRTNPAVCSYPGGKVPSSTSATVNPAGTSAIYMPVLSVVKVKISPLLSVITTSTPSIPGSPGSCTPLAFLFSNTLPLILPVGVAVGDTVSEDAVLAAGILAAVVGTLPGGDSSTGTQPPSLRLAHLLPSVQSNSVPLIQLPHLSYVAVLGMVHRSFMSVHSAPLGA